jgi:hypothetical protein
VATGRRVRASFLVCRPTPRKPEKLTIWRASAPWGQPARISGFQIFTPLTPVLVSPQPVETHGGTPNRGQFSGAPWEGGRKAEKLKICPAGGSAGMISVFRLVSVNSKKLEARLPALQFFSFSVFQFFSFSVFQFFTANNH